MTEEKTQRRVMPQNELDFHLMTTDPAVGRPEVNQGLQDQLTKYVIIDKNGKQEAVPLEKLWDSLAFYTRDIRLGNLNYWNNEVPYCQYYIDLAGDFLQAGMPRAFLICLKRAATLLELSQSKGGFLRKALNTIRQVSLSGEIEPPKKSLFGKQKTRDNQY